MRFDYKSLGITLIAVPIISYFITKALAVFEKYVADIIPYLNPVDIAFIAIAIIGVVIIWKKGKKKPKGIKLKVYRRNDLPRLADFLSQAKHQIDCVGISLESVSRGNYDTIKNALKRGVRIRLLIFDPQSQFIDDIENLVVSKNMREIIVGILGTLCRMKTELEPDKAERLEVKTYNVLPAFSMIAIDSDEELGIMHYDPYLAGTAQESRFIYEISKPKHKELFDTIFSTYRNLWNIGAEHTCK